MEDNSKIVLKSYSKVWKIERLIYSIGKFGLPMPLPMRMIIYFIFFFALLNLNLPLIRNIPYKNTLAPGILAYVFSKKLLDGKNPLMWLKSIIMHFIRKAAGYTRLNRYKRRGKEHKASFKKYISCRVVKVIEE